MKTGSNNFSFFYCKKPAQYLKNRKSAIQFDRAIVLVDFSENYSFVVQDEIQGYHWNRNQCTLHPAIVYAKDQNNQSLKAHSFCLISEDLNHDDLVLCMLCNKF